MDPEGYILVEGGRVWYKIAGAGKPGIPLLTLHGGPGYPHDYLEPLQQLADERPVIFYDQLGCGQSDQPDDRALWRIDRFLRELEQVRRSLALAQVHLFGHSWGSMLAVDYVLGGESVTSLILAGPALSIPRWRADAAQLRKTLPAEVQETLACHEAAGATNTLKYRAATKQYYHRYLCRMDPWPDQMNRSHQASSGAVYREMWGPSEFYATGNLINYDRTDRLCAIAAPTLYTCGRYDEATPEATAWYRSLTPSAEMLIFEHSAHMPHLEETDAYLSALRDFLYRVSR